MEPQQFKTIPEQGLASLSFNDLIAQTDVGALLKKQQEAIEKMTEQNAALVNRIDQLEHQVQLGGNTASGPNLAVENHLLNSIKDRVSSSDVEDNVEIAQHIQNHLQRDLVRMPAVQVDAGFLSLTIAKAATHFGHIPKFQVQNLYEKSNMWDMDSNNVYAEICNRVFHEKLMPLYVAKGYKAEELELAFVEFYAQEVEGVPAVFVSHAATFTNVPAPQEGESEQEPQVPGAIFTNRPKDEATAIFGVALERRVTYNRGFYIFVNRPYGSAANDQVRAMITGIIEPNLGNVLIFTGDSEHVTNFNRPQREPRTERRQPREPREPRGGHRGGEMGGRPRRGRGRGGFGGRGGGRGGPGMHYDAPQHMPRYENEAPPPPPPQQPPQHGGQGYGMQYDQAPQYEQAPPQQHHQPPPPPQEPQGVEDFAW